ncbi:hypothetical protein [Microlunatus sp. Gsoil 973]|jgi:hypothetical protein|uniref:hypothetical protein n=1 Tax=Microlunatus sp. Gsoil 973 TaxID=2672569 RepID=UPI0012B4AE71|nr:hypothetical protein [Microlunatus sp. Gsoil 973]QGN32490.1 hypothetical protein GJV80_06400 [Microlunatus sp. Gsoil 973]
MAADDPRDDIPEADRAEQERDAGPGFGVDPDDDDQAGSAIDDDLEIDPLNADEADQLEQAIAVPVDDEDYDQPG